MLNHPIRVLFLCTGNSARSQIAEALLRRKGGTRFLAASAGTHPADEVRPEAIAALNACGIDWLGARTKGIEAVADQRWDLVLTLCDRPRESCPTLPGQPVTGHWGVPDPADSDGSLGSEQAYSDVVRLISWRMDLMLALRIEQLDRLVVETELKGIAERTEPGNTPEAGATLPLPGDAR